MSNYVDPWGGYYKGMESLNTALSDIEKSRRLDIAERRQAELDRQAKEDWEFKKAERERQLATQRKTEELMSPTRSITEERPVTLRSAAEIMNQPDYNLAQGIPKKEIGLQSVTRPMTMQEKSAELIPYLMSRSDWAGLKGIENAQDITSKIDERTLKPFDKMADMVKTYKSQGVGDDYIKSQLRSYGDAINRMSGRQVFDVSKVDNLTFSATGATTFMPIPGSDDQLAVTKQPDGKTTVLQIKRENTAQADFIHGATSKYIKEGKTPEEAKLQAAKDYITLEQQGKQNLITLRGDNRPDKPMQQSQMVDTDGTPLLFNPNTSSYVRPGNVEPIGKPGRAASPTERKEIAAVNTLQDQINRIRTMYKPEYVGITSGPAGSVSQLWNKDEAGFRAVVSDLGDQLLRARSGAQINEQEYKRLMKIAPTSNDSTSKFMGKLDQFETTLNEIIKNRASQMRSSGVVAPTTSGPKVGSIVKGYKFLGGNPSDSKSWSKVQ